VDLVVEDGALTVRAPSGSVTAPMSGEEVHVLVDGPVLEVATRSALVGLPVWFAGGIRPPAAPVHLWWG
jgi:hypothetical protein